MSMTEIIEDMTHEMVGGDGFENYMNPPLPHNGQAYIQRDYKTGVLWVRCPWCGNKVFPISDGTKIHKLHWKCKGSKCHKEFEINVE